MEARTGARESGGLERKVGLATRERHEHGGQVAREATGCDGAIDTVMQSICREAGVMIGSLRVRAVR